MKIRVLWPGKTKQPHFRSAIADYADRIRKMVDFEIVETREAPMKDKHQKQRIRTESANLERHRKAPLCVLLDGSGKQMSSEEFAAWMERAATDIDFVVGGAAGIETQGEVLKLSLSKMTYPHEIARVVLLEQIFRALTILKRIPYHK